MRIIKTFFFPQYFCTCESLLSKHFLNISMTSLIACLTTGKGTWAYVTQVMRAQQWDKIFLITNQFGKEKYLPEAEHRGKTTLVVINEDQSVQELTLAIKNALHQQIGDFEVAINIISGTGKEHMALLAAVIQCGIGFRLVGVNSEGQYQEF